MPRRSKRNEVNNFTHAHNNSCPAHWLWGGSGESAGVISHSESDLIIGRSDPSSDYRNYYAIAWRGLPFDNLKFARHMGYHYVAYQAGMQNLSEAAGLKFYLIDPEYDVSPSDSTIDLLKTYMSDEKFIYENNYALKSDTAPFPDNIATGWWFSNNIFRVILDFQQQSVIDTTVEAIIAKAKSRQNLSLNFTFAGVMWDVPDLIGDFWTGVAATGGTNVNLAYWTGKNSCSSSIHKHDYATYSDGKAAYYKRLYQRVKEEFHDAKFIAEPWLINDWISEIKNQADAADLMPDMLAQEAPGTAFVDDNRIFNSGLITKNHVGLTTPTTFGESENRLYAAKAAINGAWFSWFGRFGGSDDMPDYLNIYEVPARLQLIRMLPNWDNLINIPLTERSWDGEVYESPNSYADANIIYSRHPDTRKIFAVFLNTAGKIKLPANEKVNSVKRTDGLFIETEDGSNDLQIINREIRLITSAGIGKGYIITTIQ